MNLAAVAVSVVVPILPAGDLSGAAVLPGAPGTPSPASGWTVRAGAGFAWPAAGAVRLGDNTTLVSPPVTVPAEAQVLYVTLAAREVPVEVRAEPLDGGPVVALDTVEPPPTATAVAVPIWPVAGRQVRLVIDPQPALGQAVEVGEVGPFSETLPGWSFTQGVAAATPGRPAVVTDRAVRMSSPVADLGPHVTALLVRARGQGRVVASVGSGRRAFDLASSYADVRVAVPASLRRAARLEVTVDPDGGRAELAQLGVVVRQPSVRGAATRRGPRTRVTGTVAGCRVPWVVVQSGTASRRVGVRAGRFSAVVSGNGRGPVSVSTGATRVCDPVTVRAAVRVRR